MFIFDSHFVLGCKKVAKYFLIAALFFFGWDFYTLLRHGHIIGGVFMALICLLIALAVFVAKGKVLVSREGYKGEYALAGIPFSFAYAFTTYKALRVEYDCLYSRAAQRHPKVLQFYLVPNARSQKTEGISLTGDICFDKEHNDAEVIDFIEQFIQASGLELIWGEGPFDGLKTLYQARAQNVLLEGERG